MAGSFHPYICYRQGGRSRFGAEQGWKEELAKVSENQSGIRFDIYERVHLQEGARSIDELDEVELVPYIQVVSQSEQAVLKGHLRLSGTYMSEGEGGTYALEHHIPVEITLPLSRVGNAQDLYVEIENFDIDLLSPRSLNVTGVLSLHGVEMMSVQEPVPDWRSEEEVVFVHRPEESAPASGWSEPSDGHRGEPPSAVLPQNAAPNPQATPAPPFSVSAAAAGTAEPPSFPTPSAVPPQYAAPNPQAAPASPFTATAANAGNAEPPAALPAEEAKPLDIDVDVNVEETEIIAGNPEQLEAQELPPEAGPNTGKKDLKVAFGSKKVAEIAQEATYGIKSLLQKSSSIFQDKRVKAETEAAAPAQEEPHAETVEWKKLFLNAAADGQEFRRLKLAIVQKEETLEAIASRYKLNPRELQLLNRLQDGEISEGQVLYIPR
jgi:stage VI sporulation protein D